MLLLLNSVPMDKHTHTQFNMDLQRPKGGLITFSTSSIHFGAYILRGNIEEPQIGLACNRERRNFARLSSKALFFLTFQGVAYENAVVHKKSIHPLRNVQNQRLFLFPQQTTANLSCLESTFLP